MRREKEARKVTQSRCVVGSRRNRGKEFWDKPRSGTTLLGVLLTDVRACAIEVGERRWGGKAGGTSTSNDEWWQGQVELS